MEIANSEQAKAWDGHEGDLWATNADRYDRANGWLQRWFDDQQVVQPDDDVLDLGCGNGTSTLAAARQASAGSALGIDLSAQMLEVARSRALDAGVANVAFVQGDAQVHPFVPGSLTLAISRFGAMFFEDPVAAFANVGAALRPGGRLGLLAWRSFAENEWGQVMRTSLAAGRTLPEPPTRGSSPFGLSDPAHVRHVLGAAGFGDVALVPVDEPMDVGSDAADALAFAKTMGMYEGLTQDLDDATTAVVTDELLRAFERAETPEGVLLGTAAWLITATRP
jgi:SAM-dependent methyltransferase